METLELNSSHANLVIKKVRVDCKPTTKNDEPVTYHFYLWSGTAWRKITRKAVPEWSKKFAEHYTVTNVMQNRLQFLFKGPRDSQPVHNSLMVLPA